MSLAHARILIIDDTPDEASVYSWYLTKLRDIKVSLDMADSGQTGLKKLAAGRYDLCFLDYKMPGMDGLQVLHRMQAAGMDTPVVMMTGGGSERVAVEALKGGAVDYVLKEDLPKLDWSSLLRRVLEIARLKKENKDLAKLNSFKNEFLDVVAGDLREPLVTIFGVANSMADGRMGAMSVPQKDALASVLREAERLYALVSDLMNLRTLSAGAPPLKRRKVALKAMTEELLGVMRRVWEDRGLFFEVSLPADPLEAECDRDLVGMVLENILTNAVEHTPHGGRIGLVLSKGVDGFVEIVVADNGTGMDPALKKTLFERYLLSDAKLSGRFKGLGLGLAISRQVVEAHGGQFRVESPGHDKGTVVTLRIPAVAPAPAAPAQPPIPESVAKFP